MSDRDAGNRRAVVVASDVTVLLLTMFLIVSRLFYKQLGMARSFEFDRVVLLGLMAGLIALRFAPIGARALVAAWAVLASSSLALAVLLFLNAPVADVVKNAAIAVVYRPQSPTKIFQQDDRYGYVLRPNTQDVAKTPDFSVTYTIGPDGHRIMPVRERPRATVVFLGDSYGFGVGVGDRETYLCVLASEFWPDVNVVNTALPGWGLTQQYVKAMDTLTGSSLPAMIVATLIPDDLVSVVSPHAGHRRREAAARVRWWRAGDARDRPTARLAGDDTRADRAGAGHEPRPDAQDVPGRGCQRRRVRGGAVRGFVLVPC